MFTLIIVAVIALTLGRLSARYKVTLDTTFDAFYLNLVLADTGEVLNWWAVSRPSALRFRIRRVRYDRGHYVTLDRLTRHEDNVETLAVILRVNLPMWNVKGAIVSAVRIALVPTSLFVPIAFAGWAIANLVPTTLPVGVQLTLIVAGFAGFCIAWVRLYMTRIVFALTD